MKKDFKFSSVFLLYLIYNILVYVLTVIPIYNMRGVIGMEESVVEQAAAILNSRALFIQLFLSLIYCLISFATARGLLRNRMGSFGEYLLNIKALTLVGFITLFLIRIIVDMGSNIIGGGLLGILIIVFSVITAYASFVVADDSKDLKFGDLIDKIIKTGKDLSGDTIAIYAKYFALPTIALLGYIIFILFSVSSLDSNIDAIAIKFMIAFAIYFILASFASTFAQKELSEFYQAYWDKVGPRHSENQEKIGEEI